MGLTFLSSLLGSYLLPYLHLVDYYVRETSSNTPYSILVLLYGPREEEEEWVQKQSRERDGRWKIASGILDPPPPPPPRLGPLSSLPRLARTGQVPTLLFAAALCHSLSLFSSPSPSLSTLPIDTSSLFPQPIEDMMAMMAPGWRCGLSPSPSLPSLSAIDPIMQKSCQQHFGEGKR